MAAPRALPLAALAPAQVHALMPTLVPALVPSRMRWMPPALAPLLAPVLALVAGLAQAASLALPGSGAPSAALQVASLALLVRLLLASASPRRAGALGWLFATAWLCGTFWWLYISMHRYGALAAPLAAAGVLGLAAFLGSYYAVACAAFRALAGARRGSAAIVFAALWLLAELARGYLWTGFPWGAGGYAHTDGPLAPLARWVGVYGVGAVAAWLAAWLAMARLRDQRVATWVAAALLAAAGWGLHVARDAALAAGDAAATPPLAVALLQGNIPQDEKFEQGSGVPLALDWYARQLHDARAALVVAPETAIPLLPRQLPPGYLDALQRRYASGDQAALVGLPTGSSAGGYRNTALGFKAGQAALYRYDKHHLVPFGEFIPPLFRWFTDLMRIPLGDFARGGLAQPPFAWRGERIAPNICYEDLFGEEIARGFADAATAPTMLVNLSNIGWFGNSVALDQHLQIARMRALEFERPMLRATNTGMTVVIDHRARVTAEQPRFTRGVLLARVQGRGSAAGAPDTRTPYARWAARWGTAPLWLAGALVVAVAAWGARRRRQTAAFSD